MTALIRSDVHQSVASKRALHHHGDSSWVPYCYDDPNSLQQVVRGLFSSGKAPAASALASTHAAPGELNPPPPRGEGRVGRKGSERQCSKVQQAAVV